MKKQHKSLAPLSCPVRRLLLLFLRFSVISSLKMASTVWFIEIEAEKPTTRGKKKNIVTYRRASVNLWMNVVYATHHLDYAYSSGLSVYIFTHTCECIRMHFVSLCVHAYVWVTRRIQQTAPSCSLHCVSILHSAFKYIHMVWVDFGAVSMDMAPFFFVVVCTSLHHDSMNERIIN